MEADIDVMAESVESGLQNDDIGECDETVRLPSDKADYMKMSVAEKDRCYPFDDKGIDAASPKLTEGTGSSKFYLMFTCQSGDFDVYSDSQVAVVIFSTKKDYRN